MCKLLASYRIKCPFKLNTHTHTHTLSADSINHFFGLTLPTKLARWCYYLYLVLNYIYMYMYLNLRKVKQRELHNLDNMMQLVETETKN